MDILALAAEATRHVALAAAEEGGAKFQINLFWVIVSAANFVVFFLIVKSLAFKGLTQTLEDRRARIEQGLKDAEQARRDRESAEQERIASLQEARREANEIINRAQKVASDTREQELTAAHEEAARIKERANLETEAERQRMLNELRGGVTDLALAAAGRVVGESMTSDRQRKLVADFLAESAAGGSKN
ncbi:MAG: F0F1 ATP synthase subunit B [Chloroflexota bacterium]